MGAPLHFLNQDSRILEQIRRGDDNALVTLFQSSRRPVCALVLRNSGTEADAEDVLQEALIILWERVKSGRHEYTAKLDTFIYATAKNLWLRRLSRMKREIPSDLAQETEASDDPSPLEAVIESEQARLIQAALTRLGEPCRTLLLLYYWEEATMEEIAAQLGFANAETAKSKKYQCKNALKRLVQEFASDYEREQ